MARDKLSEYRRKRSPGGTPEPGVEAPKARARRRKRAAAGTDSPAASGRFVVQEHRARRLHWDLRLEHDGVAASWALPKGVPQHPKENRLAVHTEDHPLEYLEFEGEIPKGEYGAGTMGVWDRGTYEAEKYREDEIILTFNGERVQGRYALFHTDGDNWMIHRMDPPADSGREPIPSDLRPMMATLSKLPRDERAWGFEIKWDGVRAIAYCDAGHLRLESRTLREITSQYPELRRLAEELGARQVVLDGEVVAFDEEGRPDFQHLQGRMHLASDSAIRRRMVDTPVTYVIFDLLYVDGRLLLDLPYEQRRAELEALGLDGEHWQTPRYHPGDGSALLEATREQGLEGIVAKRLDSRYVPGRRTRAWLKVKNLATQELVIGGWLPGEGRREGTIGALAVGYYETENGGLRLRYAGRVGTGFTEKTLRDLSKRLEPLARDSSPFEGRQPPKQTRLVEPRLVAEIEFREWTHARTLRAPSYKGLRDDKDPTEVRIELPQAPPQGQVEPAVASAGAGGPVELREGHTEIEGRVIELSSLDEVLYPKAGYRKRDAISYYAAVAGALLPHLRGRPVAVGGVREAPPWRPDWIRPATVSSQGERTEIDFCLVEDLPTLVWLANLGHLELEASLARVEDLERPTMLVLELDPSEGAEAADCAKAALLVREMLGELGLTSLVKSSGSGGLHVHVPLNGKVSFDDTGPFAHALASLLEQREPDLVGAGDERVAVGWSRNAAHETTTCVFSLGATERPAVAAPLAWEEVERAAAGDAPDGLGLEAGELLDRLDERTGLFESLLSLRQRLPKLG
jgi:bifunctional non-homologous end joining protein LigD